LVQDSKLMVQDSMVQDSKLMVQDSKETVQDPKVTVQDSNLEVQEIEAKQHHISETAKESNPTTQPSIVADLPLSSVTDTSTPNLATISESPSIQSDTVLAKDTLTDVVKTDVVPSRGSNCTEVSTPPKKAFQKGKSLFLLPSDTTKQIRLRKFTEEDGRVQFSLKGGRSDTKFPKVQPQSLSLEKRGAIKRESSSQSIDTDAAPPTSPKGGWWWMIIFLCLAFGNHVRVAVVSFCAFIAVTFHRRVTNRSVSKRIAKQTTGDDGRLNPLNVAPASPTKNCT